MYSPPRTEAAYKLARVRLEEDLRFVSQMVRRILCSTRIDFIGPLLRSPMSVFP